ncbi:MAG TPA: phospholipase D family protein [Tepidisphaeraceae bacterium]|jgi:hypothetical protein|nr:phospholipase D family protein [Tepidisphaeraceae bacterium]
MLEYVVTNKQSARYEILFERSLAAGPFTSIAVAVAYATVGGVKVLERMMKAGLGDEWDRIDKKWLVGIDWCRSDPPALDRLASLTNSRVKVYDGKAVVVSPGCTPSRTFHPKLFLLTGLGRSAIICGSGNLSANGLLRGCEAGSVSTSAAPGGEQNASHAAQTDQLLKWFRAEWRRADSYAGIATRYEAACRDRVRARAIIPTDDDSKPQTGPAAERARSLTEEQIHELRTFKNLWIDAGALGANLGAGFPGNQLDMKRFTRAFFGAPIDDLKPQTEIDHLTLVWDGIAYPGRTLAFGNNRMDKLNVPPAGDRGRDFYRDKALLFTRRDDDAYDYQVDDKRQRRLWRGTSHRTGVVHRLSRTREWGLF